MISKNIKKSSEFLIIAPQYMKIQQSKQIKYRKSSIFPPKIDSESPGILLNSKLEAINALTKHSQNLLEKVRSLSPRLKNTNYLPSNRSGRNNSKQKSKAKKGSRLSPLHNELLGSTRTEHLQPVFTSHQNQFHRRRDNSKNFSSRSETNYPDTKQYHGLLQRTRQIFGKFGQNLRELQDANERLILENSRLKSKLTKYQRL